jgi:hypothetical protein
MKKAAAPFPCRCIKNDLRKKCFLRRLAPIGLVCIASFVMMIECNAHSNPHECLLGFCFTLVPDLLRPPDDCSRPKPIQKW